jgi:hypothetical protein
MAGRSSLLDDAMTLILVCFIIFIFSPGLQASGLLDYFASSIPVMSHLSSANSILANSLDKILISLAKILIICFLSNLISYYSVYLVNKAPSSRWFRKMIRSALLAFTVDILYSMLLRGLGAQIVEWDMYQRFVATMSFSESFTASAFLNVLSTVLLGIFVVIFSFVRTFEGFTSSARTALQETGLAVVLYIILRFTGLQDRMIEFIQHNIKFFLTLLFMLLGIYLMLGAVFRKKRLIS